MKKEKRNRKSRKQVIRVLQELHFSTSKRARPHHIKWLSHIVYIIVFEKQYYVKLFCDQKSQPPAEHCRKECRFKAHLQWFSEPMHCIQLQSCLFLMKHHLMIGAFQYCSLTLLHQYRNLSLFLKMMSK